MKEVEINLKTSSLFFFFFFFVHSRKSFKCMSYSHFNDSHTLGVYIQLTTRHNSIWCIGSIFSYVNLIDFVFRLKYWNFAFNSVFRLWILKSLFFDYELWKCSFLYINFVIFICKNKLFRSSSTKNELHIKFKYKNSSLALFIYMLGLG